MNEGGANLWPDRFVRRGGPLLQLPAEFQRAVDNAADERPLQKWLERHPVALLSLLPGTDSGWVFAQPKFGAEYVPDLMLCTHDSRGYHWHLIELENPTRPVLTKKGEQSHAR